MQITLAELLDAREERARCQKRMIAEHGFPLISFTMNIAGPTKNSPLIERAFAEGVRRINKIIGNYFVAERFESHTKCGPMLICSVRCDALELKSKLVKIEDTHPIGRLFDMDVITSSAEHMTRPTERGCIVCGASGRACAAGRLHKLADILRITEKILSDYFSSLDGEFVANLIWQSLLQEVYTEPKPGLVDPVSRGSHNDMDVSTFECSANALKPYFKDCVRLGFEYKNQSYGVFFPALRELGILAEDTMLVATCGINTHKGTIFSMGILAAAVGRLMRPDGYMPDIELLLSEAANICRDGVESDFKKMNGATAGGRAFLELGERGIRGEAAEGFPSVRKIAIPVYTAELAKGKSKNDAGVITLLHLIANVFDTSIYNRGGKEGVFFSRSLASSIIASEEPNFDDIRTMDTEFIQKNLSPGGCADLLAITYFLTEFEDRRKKQNNSSGKI